MGGQNQTAGWKLIGPGQVSIDEKIVRIQGRRARPFWTSAPFQADIPWHDIRDVSRAGKVVSFSTQTANLSDKPLSLWAPDEETAQLIVGQLPTTQTEKFQRVSVERAEFDRALVAIGARSVVMPALVAMNCLVFGLTVWGGAGFAQSNGAVLIKWGTNFSPDTLGGEWWRLLTSMFLHFGVAHLLLNMWALWSMGQLVERLYGSVYFLVIYLFAGLAGSIASLLWHPIVNSAGASGAIFGVIGALLAFMLNPATRIPASVAAAGRSGALVFIAYNLVNGASHRGIDNADHVGGLIGGFALGWLLARPLNPESRMNPFSRLATAAAVGMLALTGVAWPLSHPTAAAKADMQFRKNLEDFFEQEARILADQEKLDELESSHAIDHREWGRRLGGQIVPEWQASEDKLDAAEVLPGNAKLQPVQAKLAQYLRQKVLALTLQSEAAESGDPGKQQWADQVTANNRASLMDLRRLLHEAN